MYLNARVALGGDLARAPPVGRRGCAIKLPRSPSDCLRLSAYSGPESSGAASHFGLCDVMGLFSQTELFISRSRTRVVWTVITRMLSKEGSLSLSLFLLDDFSIEAKSPRHASPLDFKVFALYVRHSCRPLANKTIVWGCNAQNLTEYLATCFVLFFQAVLLALLYHW